MEWVHKEGNAWIPEPPTQPIPLDSEYSASLRSISVILNDTCHLQHNSKDPITHFYFVKWSPGFKIKLKKNRSRLTVLYINYISSRNLVDVEYHATLGRGGDHGTLHLQYENVESYT